VDANRLVNQRKGRISLSILIHNHEDDLYKLGLATIEAKLDPAVVIDFLFLLA